MSHGTAAGAHGSFWPNVVVWARGPQLRAQPADSGGQPVGGPIAVGAATSQDIPSASVASTADGGFVVALVVADSLPTSDQDTVQAVQLRKFGADGALQFDVRVMEKRAARKRNRPVYRLDLSRSWTVRARFAKLRTFHTPAGEIMKHAMKVVSIACTSVCLLLASGGVAAADVGLAVGGGVGGAAGALIGSQVGGKNGAVIGGALGGGVGAAATTSGSGKTGAIVGGALGGGAGAAVGQKLGGSTGAVVGAGAGGALGASAGKSLTEKGSAQAKVVAQPAPAAVVVRADGEGRAYASPGRGNFCPPGQAKKGRC